MSTETVGVQTSGNKFAQALARKALVFEPRPLRNIEDVEVAKSSALEFREHLRTVPRLDAINVVDVKEERHDGRPKQHGSVFEREYTTTIADSVGREAMVNKVVVYLKSYSAFKEWVLETRKMGIRNLIFVGGQERYKKYPGPSPSEATIAARHILNQTNDREEVLIGGIFLPQRRGEAQKRLLYKSLVGMQFFTTQILFETDDIRQPLLEFHAQLREAGLEPKPVLLSFAAIMTLRDHELIDDLGATIPERYSPHELHLLHKGSVNGDLAKTFTLNALRIYTDAAFALEERGVNLPIGVNVEQISGHCLPASIMMLRAFERIIDMPWSELRADPEERMKQIEQKVSDIIEK